MKVFFFYLSGWYSLCIFLFYKVHVEEQKSLLLQTAFKPVLGLFLEIKFVTGHMPDQLVFFLKTI